MPLQSVANFTGREDADDEALPGIAL